ncbi:MAG TPA: ATP-dependent RNA helicase RhlB, partial [Gammaproteobacteria bacterium]|nr:ATP-dependent RNA helicase RhlB [Gammaproteobacteria bacterium]
RIGRTGRAGQIGTSVNFATEEEAFSIPDIEAHLGMKFRCEYPSEDLLADLPEGGNVERRRPPQNRSNNNRGGNNRRRNTRHPRNRR